MPARYITRHGIRYKVTPIGLIACPVADGLRKKHACRDCFSCQWCADERCHRCLRAKRTAGRRKGR
ncbi:hypothetical protein GX586_14170 [bacterium]|nr:hypothetical protein [bacterium]